MAKRRAKQTNEQATNSREVAEQVRSEALRRYGKAIFNATQVYEAELERLAYEAGIQVRDVPKPPPAYRTAQSVLMRMGLAIQRAKDGSIDEDGKRLFTGLNDALRPPVDARSTGRAVKRAVDLVEDYASYYATEPESERNSIVWIAICSLVTDVHSGFAVLEKSDVGALFDRIIESTPRSATGRAPRNRKAGSIGALTAAGILCELNKMARYPLGSRLTADSIYHAVKRQR
jgi:hypothetical protein